MSLLRNGFEHADGLDITIVTDEGGVILDVADEVVAYLHDFEEEAVGEHLYRV